jgi:geranylgeranyl diphosphate synthase type I
LAAYQQIGDPLGDAFQLRDDVLGVFGDPEVTGKSNLDDLREGKPTVLVTLARERADAAQATLLESLIANPALTQSEAEQVRRVIDDTGAREAVEQLIDRRMQTALRALEEAPVTGEAASALRVLAGRLADRQW